MLHQFKFAGAIIDSCHRRSRLHVQVQDLTYSLMILNAGPITCLAPYSHSEQHVPLRCSSIGTHSALSSANPEACRTVSKAAGCEGSRWVFRSTKCIHVANRTDHISRGNQRPSHFRGSRSTCRARQQVSGWDAALFRAVCQKVRHALFLLAAFPKAAVHELTINFPPAGRPHTSELTSK